MATLLFDNRAGESRLVAIDVVLAQDVTYRLNAGLNRRLVVGGTVLTEQVLQNVRRDNGVALDGLHKVLANHRTGEILIDFLVERRGRKGSPFIRFLRHYRRGAGDLAIDCIRRGVVVGDSFLTHR